MIPGVVIAGHVHLTAIARATGDGTESLLLVVGWAVPKSERPLVLLVSPAARRATRTGRWSVRAYRKRWGVEDATHGAKQRFAREQFPVRWWMSIRRWLWLVAWAFWRLNLRGDEEFREFRRQLMDHPWRLRKAVTSPFNWIATVLRRLLHPPAKWKDTSG